MKYKTGLIVGKFQPFHHGHISMIKQGLSICESLKIVIGGSNRSFEIERPLTITERLEMVNLAIDKEGWDDKIKQVKILDDIMDNLEWMDNLINLAGDFDVIIGNDATTIALAKYFNLKTFRPELTRREIWQATIIRNKILAGESWQELVPEYEIELLEKFGLEERLKELNESDK